MIFQLLFEHSAPNSKPSREIFVGDINFCSAHFCGGAAFTPLQPPHRPSRPKIAKAIVVEAG
jgi:hypothetical protein